MKITEVFTLTGEVIERDATKAELEQSKIDKQTDKAVLAETNAKANAKAALLDRLGITADEAALLLG